MIKKTVKSIILIFCFILLVLSTSLIIKGERGNLIFYQHIDERRTTVGSPFESSGSTSRYTLTEAIVEDGTFFLNEERARFASPDVSKLNDKYFSIFTPGVSFIGVPFYWLGKQVGTPQLVSYISTALIALINAFLVARIAKKLVTGFTTAFASGLLFLFATNALSYSLTFTQHHASTLVILLGILSALGSRSLINNLWFGVLYGAGLLIDIPNGLIMLPLTFYILAKQFETTSGQGKIKLALKLNFVGLLIGLLPLVGLFGWYNYQTTGSYTTLAQFVGRSKDFAVDSQRVELSSTKTSRLTLPFNTRNQLEGFYILLISNQRGLFVYSPIILIGLLGLYLVFKDKGEKGKAAVLSAVVLTNFITYTLFSDPTGSWAFGPRYLIPAIAALSTGTGIVLDKYKKRLWFIPVFLLLAAYSIGVNVLGAMTTAQVPPKVEAVNLPEPIPYTYKYNWQLMTEDNLNSSLVYNLYLSDKLSSRDFALIYASATFGLVMILYLVSFFENPPSRNDMEGKGKLT